MSENKSILTEMLERRIPQILGVFVASVWLAVEVSEWIIERFGAPDQTSSYVGVIMISFLPLVGLLAWGHGRPGKDKWTQKQLLFIPINIGLAWFAVTTFIKPVEVVDQSVEVQATQIMALTDEQTGELVEYEVAKTGLSQKVTGFFWANNTGDETLDWLSYGSMWMVAKDLMRNPVISIRTPFDSPALIRGITNRGFERAVGEPLALNLEMSSDRNSQWMINGQITKEGDKLTFEASLYDVITGALVTTITSSYDDWLFALDDLAEQLGELILDNANIAPSIIPDRPLSEHISNNLKAIESVVDSLSSVRLDNDFEAGVTQLKEALVEDDQLAEAYLLMLEYYRGMGDFEQAKEAGEAALRLEYKLSQESKLKAKANYYALNGEQDRAIRVLENWVKISPESIDALMALGGNYIILGNRLDDALAVFEKLNELQDSSTTALVNTARIYRLKDNKQAALSALKRYKELNPDKASPLLEMAATNLQFGDLAAAEDNFEEASLLSFNDISADLGLAKLKGLNGDIEASLNAFDRLLKQADSDSEKVQVLTEKETLLAQTGRVAEALDVVKVMRDLSKSYMAPLSQDFLFGSKEIAYFSFIDDFDTAWQKLAEMKANAKPPFDQILMMMDMTIYQLMGDDENTLRMLEKFEQFTFEFQMMNYKQFIQSTRAHLARKAGNYDEALALYNEALADSKQSFLTLNSLAVLDQLIFEQAKTLLDKGSNEEVLTTIEVVLKRNPLHGQGHLLKAKALFALGQMDQAKQAVQTAHEIWSKADADYNHLKELQEFEAQLMEAGT